MSHSWLSGSKENLPEYSFSPLEVKIKPLPFVDI
jgi:hypothetical protein